MADLDVSGGDAATDSGNRWGSGAPDSSGRPLAPITSRHPLVRRVERFIRAEGLLALGEGVLVAVSGGADSVFLTCALHALAPVFGVTVHLAHFDHGWRPEQAQADAAFVAHLADELGLAAHFGTADTRQLAADHKHSPEDAARQARYAFLTRLCRAQGLSKVATGHQQDDQVESVLMALLRGSGALGLGGIAPIAPLPVSGPLRDAPTAPLPASAVSMDASLAAERYGNPGSASQPDVLQVIRPLLPLSRQAIRQALADAGHSWRDDPTNQSLPLLRNRLRGEGLPLLETMAPGFRQAVVRSGALAQEAAAYIERQAQAAAQTLFSSGDTGATNAAPDGGEPGQLRYVSRVSADRRAFLALDPALQAPVLRAAVVMLRGDARNCEWAHLRGAVRVIHGGRGGAGVHLAPEVWLRLHQGRILVELREPAPPTIL